jgi:hypothetical protein
VEIHTLVGKFRFFPADVPQLDVVAAFEDRQRSMSARDSRSDDDNPDHGFAGRCASAASRHDA